MSQLHKTILEADLHETKGASTASTGQYLTADGVGGSVWATKFVKFTSSLSPAIVAANTTAEQTFTITGLVLSTDIIVTVSKPTAQAGLGIVGWRVSADNTLAITFSNNTGAGITPTAAQTYSVLAYRGT